MPVVGARIDVRNIHGSATTVRWSRAGRVPAPSTYTESGVPVVALRGEVGLDGFLSCRDALTSALNTGARTVVLDLRRARVHDGSIPMLSLVRRWCRRRGAALVLLVAGTETEAVLRRARVLPLYRIVSGWQEAIAIEAAPSS
jgi:hypothetical protein